MNRTDRAAVAAVLGAVFGIAAILLLLVLAGCSAPGARTGTPHTTGRTAATVQLIGARNPAVTQTTLKTTVCRKGWTATIRPPLSYTDALKRSQLPRGARLSAYEEDHLMPLELGGAPREVANLKPIPITRARADDKVETRLHRQLCAGTITLTQAQQQISRQKAGE